MKSFPNQDNAWHAQLANPLVPCKDDANNLVAQLDAASQLLLLSVLITDL